MELEPITRKEKIIAGQDLTPITRTEKFLKQFGGGGGGGSVPAAGGVTTLHINVTAVNQETMEETFTADKTPAEMQQASINGPIWCVLSFAAGVLAEEAVSMGFPPAILTDGRIAFWRLAGLGNAGVPMNEAPRITIVPTVLEENGSKWVLADKGRHL